MTEGALGTTIRPSTSASSFEGAGFPRPGGLIEMRTARVLSAAGRLALLSLAVASPAVAGMPPVNWVKGPTTADLGEQAQIQIGAAYTFANAGDSKKLMEAMGNTVSNDEVGLVMPRAKDQDWFMLFEYQDVGYVKDTDKDQID